MKLSIRLTILLGLLLGLLLYAGYSSLQAKAQTGGTLTFIENFSNNSFPPQLNTTRFNHTFTLPTAWDLTGPGFNDPPPPQTPPYALRLFAGNDVRITFNLPPGATRVTEAEVWGYAPVAPDASIFGQGRIVFEGTTDGHTFDFVGGVDEWEQFRVTAADVGDGGNAIGEIVAVRLIDVGNNGYAPIFDDLTVTTATASTPSSVVFLPFVIR